MFIGATAQGGHDPSVFGNGVIYLVRPDGRFKRLHALGYPVHGSPDGDGPSGGLLLGRSGQVTGVTIEGGRFGRGTIWTLVPVPN